MAISQFPSKGGIPSGNTAARPGSPVIGDTFYNGQLEILEIYNGTEWVAASAPPATPTIATPTDASTGDAYTSTAGKLSVVFTKGSNGGSPSQYNAYTTAGGHSGSSSSSTVTISGLTPGTSYTVYGTAQNNFGVTTNTENATVVAPTTLPAAPTIGTATDTQTGGTLSVTFTAGNSGGKSITNYQYQLNGTGSYTAFSPAQTTSPIIISGLTNGTSYTVKLKAVNANGAGAESSASNSAIPTASITVDYLVVAGGGAGGPSGTSYGGGGGGAGGVRSTITATGGSGSLESALILQPSTNYTVTVGAGGAAGSAAENVNGNNGSNSIFSTITSNGGGGGRGPTASGFNAGSVGSGAGGANSAGQNGTSTQGYNGGTNPSTQGGGGGGASANGTGAGGNGRAISITGSSVTYGGGGGGGPIYGASSPGAGGTGGGGEGAPGATSTQGYAGTANTGGGGGAGSRGNGGSLTSGGGGGSGVVILRWLTSFGTITVGAGLTADATGTDGSYSYKRFTAGSGNVSWS
jgi:hypothetical protein